MDNATKYAREVIAELWNDDSVNVITYEHMHLPIAKKANVIAKSKLTSLMLAKKSPSNARELHLKSIHYLIGFTVEVRTRNGQVRRGRLHYESGQYVVRNGQRVLTNFHFTNKSQINTKNNRIIA